MFAHAPGGSILLAGTFVGTTDFDSGPGSTTVLSTRAFSEDFFITQFSSAGAFQPMGGTPNEADPEAARLALRAVPNPARAGQARITTEALGSTRISVLDALGREVAVLFDSDAGAGRELSLRLPSTLAPGAYVVRSVSEGRVQALPVTVVR